MIKAEHDKGVVEWRRGLLVLHSTATFAKHILPKFFSTRNFKTFRRQLNYYGFVHVRSFSNTAAATTTALWVHQELAAAVHNSTEGNNCGGNTVTDPDDLSLILTLRRVEPNDDHKTVEGRRKRKVMALNTVEEDLQVSNGFLQQQQIQALLNFVGSSSSHSEANAPGTSPTSLSSCSSPTPSCGNNCAPSPDRAHSAMDIDSPAPATVAESALSVGVENENGRAPMFVPVTQSSHKVLPAEIQPPQHVMLLHCEEPRQDEAAEEMCIGLALEEESSSSVQTCHASASVQTCYASSSVPTCHASASVQTCYANDDGEATADATSVSSSGRHSVGIVSESDEELSAPRPPKTEKSAANLLLLLSQGGPSAFVTVR